MPALFLIVFERLRDELQVVVEAGGQSLDLFLLHPAVQHLLLQRNVDRLVAIARLLFLIVEGPHERVGEEDPDEALGIEVVGHHGAIGDALLDIELVEQIREIRIALLLLQLRFLADQPLGVLGRQVAIGIVEQRLGCCHQFGIRVPLAQGRAARRRRHGIHVRIIGESRGARDDRR